MTQANKVSSKKKNSADEVLKRPARIFPLVRHLARPVTLVLRQLPITPNQITYVSLVLGLLSSLALLSDGYGNALISSVLLLGCYVLDNCDGEIARLKGLSSEFGKRLDTFVDWIVHAAFFLCLGWGVAEGTSQSLWLWFGVLAAFGGTVNYAIDVIRDMRDKATSVHRVEDGPDQNVTDRVVYSTRVIRTDFCFIVLFLSLVDNIWILLPASAIGAQFYWGIQFVKGFRRHHV